jgi:hypothetical protein
MQDDNSSATPAPVFSSPIGTPPPPSPTSSDPILVSYGAEPPKRSRRKKIIIFSLTSVAVLALALFLGLYLVPNLSGISRSDAVDIISNHEEDIDFINIFFQSVIDEEQSLLSLLQEDTYARLSKSADGVKTLCDAICDRNRINFGSDEDNELFKEIRDFVAYSYDQYIPRVAIYELFYETFSKNMLDLLTFEPISYSSGNLPVELSENSDESIRLLAADIDDSFSKIASLSEQLRSSNCLDLDFEDYSNSCSSLDDMLNDELSFIFNEDNARKLLSTNSLASFNPESGSIFMKISNFISSGVE